MRPSSAHAAKPDWADKTNVIVVGAAEEFPDCRPAAVVIDPAGHAARPVILRIVWSSER